jgi:hypothetical protein
MAEDYLDWHTGVELDRKTRTWRGYVEPLDGGERRFTEESYANKEDAAVAASDLLTRLREGTPPGEGKSSGLPRL